MRSAWRTVFLASLAVLLPALWYHAADAPAKAAISEDTLKKVEAALPDKAPAKPAKPRTMLILTLTKGFRHSSIPLAATALELMGKRTGAFQATSTDDINMLKAETLSKFDALCSDQCTGNLTDDAEIRKSIVAFVSGGKGLVGIHAATDAGGWDFPEFHEMIGGLFAGHGPGNERVSVKIDDPANPINAAFGGRGFDATDEIYTFKDPYSRDKLHILLSIDIDGSGPAKGGKRPDQDYALSWIREYGKGRVFYCAFGHQDPIWFNPALLKHYLAGIQYALGDLKANATPSAKLNLRPVRGPVLGGAPEKPKPAPRVNKAPVAAATAAATAEPSGLFLKPDAQGWITLFNGKNLDAWQNPPADKWKIVDGILTWQKGCGDLWTKDKFGDFILDLEVKCDKNTNSGVFLRSPEGEKNWLQGSFEIQVMGSFGNRKPSKHDMGALYDCYAPTVAAEKPVGEWNHMVITFKGNKLQVVLNDKTIVAINLDDWKEAGMNPDGTKNKFKTAYKDMAKVGHLGLQDHGAPVWYRNIKVKPLN